MIAFQILLQYVLFFLAMGISFYIPGLYVLSLVSDSFTKEQKQFLSWPIGYSCFIVLSYISGWMHMPLMSLVFVILVTLYVLIKKRNLINLSFPKANWSSLFVIIVGSLAFTSMSFFSGLITKNGLQFIGMVNSTDGLMHIAHIKTQAFLFPPPYAGFVGYAMRGYHYFYDFLLSRFVLFFHFSAEDLYYRLFPFVISLFYGGSIYFFSKLFTQKKSVLIFILFFAYFGQSWGFVLSLFTKTVDITNGLGLVQPLELILDPSAIFAFALMLCGFYLLLSGKLNLQKALLVGLVLGPLAQMKVYAGIISIFTLGILILYALITKKSVRMYVVSLIIIGILTALTYLPNNIGIGHIVFLPFFLYDIFIRQNQLFDFWNWDMRMVIYHAHHNIPHILFMDIVAFILFWVLTLGSRIFVLLSTASILKKDFWKSNLHICYTVILLIPLLIGSIFIQSFSAFNTIQFLWIVGLAIAIPAGIFYAKIYDKFPTIGKIFLIAFLLFCSGGSTLANERIYLLQYYKLIITPSQMSMIKAINTRVGKNQFVVVAPRFAIDKYGQKIFLYETPFFAALSGRQTYYEFETPEFYNQQAIDYRKKQEETITKHMEKCDGNSIAAIMKHIGTQYLVTTTNIKCHTLFHMQKIAVGGNWTFWIVN